jgi:putative chitinase
VIQTTLRGNYEALGKALGLDLLANPDLLLDPKTAARALAYFFKAHGIAALADAQDWLHVRIRVNGINRTTGLPNSWGAFHKYALALVAYV